MMESTDSSSGAHQRPQEAVQEEAQERQQVQLPPGFRFHPTDEELVVHYLKRKVASAPIPVAIIAEVELYKFDPWELPGKAAFGEQEWYFFSPRDRKYPNGARPNRAATSGYWKATGTDKPILATGGAHKVGVKKALVFYKGKPPKGTKTNWIMHEYRLVDGPSMIAGLQSSSGEPSSKKKNSLRLDDWVLCRIYKKSNKCPSDDDLRSFQRAMVENERDDPVVVNDMEAVPAQNAPPSQFRALPGNYDNAIMENEEIVFFDGLLTTPDGMNTAGKRVVTSPYMMNATATATATAPTLPAAKRLASTSNGTAGSTGAVAAFLNQLPVQGMAYLGDGSTASAVSLQHQYQFTGINWMTQN